jgi:hypothetical protein
LATTNKNFKVKNGLQIDSLTASGYLANDATGTVTSVPTIPNSGLTNSQITINGTAVALGGSITVAGGSGGGVTVTYATTAPTSPAAKDVWIDANTGIEYTYVTDANSSQWVELGPTGQTGPTGPAGPAGPQGLNGGVKYTFATTVPTSPSVGDVWIDSNTGSQYTYLYDGNTYQWVELGSTGQKNQSTITWARNGQVTVTTGVSRYLFPYAATILGVSATINTPPVGSDIILDVKKNGTTIFTTSANKPRILATAYSTAAEVTNMDITSVAVGDYVTIDINQIGSITPGSDLTVFVRYQ